MARPQPPQPREQQGANPDEAPWMSTEQADELQRNALLSVLCFPPTGLAAFWQARNANSAARTGNNTDANYYNKSTVTIMSITIFLALCNPIILAVIRQQLAGSGPAP